MRKKGIRMLSLFLAVVLMTAFSVVPKAETDEEVNGSATECRYIYFGSYPQSEVTDEATTAAIDAAIDEAFEAGNISYGDQGIDVTLDGVQYRRVNTHYFRWEPIKWRVLKDEGETLFVVACRGLDVGEYKRNDSVNYEDVTWETSSLRSWMNWQFRANAFTSEEWNAVVTQTVKNPPNPEYGTTGGNDTQDKVFALSYEEVTNPELGFRQEDNVITASRMIIPSEYAVYVGKVLQTYEDNMLNAVENETANWWLRSPGQYSYQAVNVNYDGTIDSSGFLPNMEYAVVPAMHIDASSEWITEADGQGEIKPLEKVPAPTASLPSGSEVTFSTTIELSCSVENATIYYTMDGTKPTRHSTKYSDGVRIGMYSTILKAIAIGGGYEESDVAVFEYTVKRESTTAAEPGSGNSGSDSSGTSSTDNSSGSQAENTGTGSSDSVEENDKTSSSNGSDGNNETSGTDGSSAKKEVAVGAKFTDTASYGIYKVTSKKNGSGTVEYVKPVNSKVTKADIPSTITYAGITYKVTAVGEKAFLNCSKLKTITIGKNVTSIGKRAFYGCKNLKKISIKATKLTSKKVGSKAFKGIAAKAVIKVPKSKLSAYKKLLKSKGVGSKITIKQ